jgi:hypothetical protein
MNPQGRVNPQERLLALVKLHAGMADCPQGKTRKLIALATSVMKDGRLDTADLRRRLEMLGDKGDN